MPRDQTRVSGNQTVITTQVGRTSKNWRTPTISRQSFLLQKAGPPPWHPIDCSIHSQWSHSSASLGSISHLEMFESSSLFLDGSKGLRPPSRPPYPNHVWADIALFLEHVLPLFLLSTPIHLPIPNSCIFEGYLHHPPSINTFFLAPLPKRSTLGSSLNIQWLAIALIILSKMWHLNN